MQNMVFACMPPFHRVDAEPLDLNASLRLETVTVSALGEVFYDMRRAEHSLLRENLTPSRFLLGSLAYLQVVAAERNRSYLRQIGMGVVPIDFGTNEEPRVFNLPTSLDPSKPGEWVQCLPETNIRNATFRHLPKNIGVSRGLVADTAESIRSVVEKATERRIILPEEAAAEIAKVAVVTSYWDQPMPRKREFEWDGSGRK